MSTNCPKHLAGFVLSAFCICSCAAPQPSAEQLSVASAVKRPSSDLAAQNAVRAYFSAALKDPYSAQFAFLPLKNGPGIFSDGVSSVTLPPGWFMCGLVNAKNAFGGYVGATAFIAHFDPARGDAVDEGYIKTIRYSVDANEACNRFYGPVDLTH